MISITECSVCKSRNIKVGRMVRPGWLWVWVVLSVGGVLVVCPIEVHCRNCGAKMAAQELPPPLWSLLPTPFNWIGGRGGGGAGPIRPV